MAIEIQHMPTPALVGLAGYQAGRNRWQNQQNNFTWGMFRDQMRYRQEQAMQRQQLLAHNQLAYQSNLWRQNELALQEQQHNWRLGYQQNEENRRAQLREQGENARTEAEIRGRALLRPSPPPDPFDPGVPEGVPFPDDPDDGQSPNPGTAPPAPRLPYSPESPQPLPSQQPSITGSWSNPGVPGMPGEAGSAPGPTGGNGDPHASYTPEQLRILRARRMRNQEAARMGRPLPFPEAEQGYLPGTANSQPRYQTRPGQLTP